MPKFYFNSYQNFLSNSDVTIILMNNGRPNVVLHCSHGTGKSLVGAIGESIQDQEEKSGYYFPSIEEMYNKLNPQQGE